MADSGERQSANGRRIDDVDRADQISDGEDSVNISPSGAQTSVSASQSVTQRLAEIFVEDGDGDLLLQRSDREDGVLQWLRALDMQVMGACRADERLKPLLKLNVSTGVVEDGLLAHLSQHFEPSEVGFLARCLCVPLVSIRVGKINKQGILLYPTSIRQLPSDRIEVLYARYNVEMGSMYGWNQFKRQLSAYATFVLSATDFEPIVTSVFKSDRTGQFNWEPVLGLNVNLIQLVISLGNLCLTLLPTSDLRISFNGDDGSVERLATLSTEAQCTDVEIEEIPADKSGRSFLLKTSEVSLASTVSSHLRAYLTGSVITSAQASDILSATTADESVDSSSEFHPPQSSFNCQKSSRFRPFGSQGSKTNLIYLGSLSPRSSSFKEGLQKSLSTIKSAAREKLRRRVENYVSCIDIDSLSLASSNSTNPSSSNSFQKDKLPEVNGTLPFSALNFLDVFGKSTELPVSAPEIKLPSSPPSPFSPQYCWCPPVASALQYTIGNPQLPISSAEPFSLPPLSSLLSSAMPSTLLTSKPLLNVAELPPLNFPSFLPEPIVRLPSSQQIPTFTPFICDPIVHIPVIDICSSGQGYLVSAGPSMSTSIPPLVDPLLPNSESTVEKSARETLRMLINSSNQPNPPLLNVLPNVLSSSNGEQNIFAAGSRGLYSGTRDVVAITNSMSTMGLVLLSEKSMGGGIGRDDLIDQKEKPSSSGPSCFDEGID
ncbi:hypothetical protein DH2020_044187 [Rehmannia glutinosa]|uniref:Uncharacterized protein n=1 Tax=Rehmannia glutinosa TaxID=99300 RepID=A0ABR0UHK6_REHGL